MKTIYFILLGFLIVSLFVVPHDHYVSAQPRANFGEPSVPEPICNWTRFWQLFNAHTDWDLEYNAGAGWIGDKSSLQIIKNYTMAVWLGDNITWVSCDRSEASRCKITLNFTAGQTADYRLTFAIDLDVKNYTYKTGAWNYTLSYQNYTVFFDWSDLRDLPLDSVTHGILPIDDESWFWFRIRKNGINEGRNFVVDPSFGNTVAEPSNRGGSSTEHTACRFSSATATATVRPNANVATQLSAVPGGRANWDCVDETPASDADYVKTGNTIEQKDLYTTNSAALDSGSKITSVTVYWRARYVSATCYGRPRIRALSQTVLEGTLTTLTSSWTLRSQTWTYNPNTGTVWNAAEVNDLDVGVGISCSLGEGEEGQCSQVYVVISYGNGDTADVDFITIYCASSSGTINGEAAIYTDDPVNQKPDDRLEAATGYTSMDTSFAWRNFTWSGTKPQITVGSVYWIAWRPTSAVMYVKMNTAGETNQDRQASGGSLPDPWGTAGTGNTFRHSSYATYTVEAGGEAYVVDLTLALIESWAILRQATFNILSTWNYGMLLNILRTVAFNIVLTTTNTFQWLIEVIWTAVGNAYTVDLTMLFGEGWMILRQLSFNVVPEWNFNPSYTVLRQTVFNVLFTMTETFSWLVTASIGVCNIVILSFGSNFSWLLNLLEGIVTEVDYTFGLAALAFVVAISALALIMSKKD